MRDYQLASPPNRQKTGPVSFLYFSFYLNGLSFSLSLSPYLQFKIPTQSKKSAICLCRLNFLLLNREFSLSTAGLRDYLYFLALAVKHTTFPPVQLALLRSTENFAKNGPCILWQSMLFCRVLKHCHEANLAHLNLLVFFWCDSL